MTLIDDQYYFSKCIKNTILSTTLPEDISIQYSIHLCAVNHTQQFFFILI